MKSSALKNGLESALILALVMGFGRFAYTALYPYMVTDDVLSVAQGSVVASANYVGYLVGALLAVRIKADKSNVFALIALIGTSVCLALMSVLSGALWVGAVRFLAGVFSALVSCQHRCGYLPNKNTPPPRRSCTQALGLALPYHRNLWCGAWGQA